MYTHKAWIERDLKDWVRYPMLADLTKSMSREYGVLLEDRGFPLRGTFLVDPDGVVQHVLVNNLKTGRSIDEILRTLDALQTGELCPANWRAGQPALQPVG